MKLKKLTAVLISAVITFSCCAVYADTQETTADTEEQTVSAEYSAFEQIAEYVSQFYIDDSLSIDDVMKQGLSKLLEDNDPLLVSLLKSMLESLDDYSEFYTADEYKQFNNTLNRTFYGIGIVMSEEDENYITVSGFSEDSAAEEAGVEIGDKIYKVDGTDMTGKTMKEVRSKIIGEEGTEVTIVFLRDGSEVTVTVKRGAVNSATVSSTVYDGNIGYIKISSFGVNTADEFTEALNTMREKNVEKIILDLRDNVGGLVLAAVQIAREIVPKGTIIDVKYRNSEENVTYTSDLADEEFDFAVLVNENTASASEILASAMQDSGCAKLIGTKTFGKGVIQTQYPLSNGSVFKLTTGEYTTRNGNQINKIGLTPDVEVSNSSEKINTSEYTQFDYKTRVSLGNSGDNVKAVRERLKVLGYYSGDTESNVYDEEIKSAVKDFQRINDLFSYGVLDIATQKKIDEMFSDIDVYYDNQFETVYKMFTESSEEE